MSNEPLKKSEVEIGLDEDGFFYFEAGSKNALYGFLEMLLKGGDDLMPDPESKEYRDAEKAIEEGRSDAVIAELKSLVSQVSMPKRGQHWHGWGWVYDEDDWVRDTRFGFCPACGAIGMEDCPTRDSDSALFKCSKGCLTRYNPDPKGFTLMQKGGEIRPTKWSEIKPGWWKGLQAQGKSYSWNWKHFDEEFCLEHDLV